MNSRSWPGATWRPSPGKARKALGSACSRSSRLQARLIDAQQKAEELFITDDEADPLSRNI